MTTDYLRQNLDRLDFGPMMSITKPPNSEIFNEILDLEVSQSYAVEVVKRELLQSHQNSVKIRDGSLLKVERRLKAKNRP
jgi:hypothetical protein